MTDKIQQVEVAEWGCGGILFFLGMVLIAHGVGEIIHRLDEIISLLK
jgi:hypothetical protein